jgi:hypothetical protein
MKRNLCSFTFTPAWNVAVIPGNAAGSNRMEMKAKEWAKKEMRVMTALSS